MDKASPSESSTAAAPSPISNGIKKGKTSPKDPLEVTPFKSGAADEDEDGAAVKIVKTSTATAPLSRDPSFLRALILAFWRPFAISALLNLLALTLQLLSPVILARLIRFANLRGKVGGEPMWKGYSYALCLFLLEVGRALVHQHHFYFCFVLGIKLRTAVMTVGYIFIDLSEFNDFTI